MKQFIAVSCLFLTCFIQSVLKPVYAGPIQGPFWIVDTPTNVFVSFSHGPVVPGAVHNVGPFVSPSGFWSINTLNINENELPSTGVDTLKLDAMLQHIKGPHTPEVAGGIFNFKFDFTASLGPIISLTDGPFTKPHPGLDPAHNDIASAAVRAITDQTLTDIKIFGLNVKAVHVPEPSTLFLFFFGIGLFLYRKIFI